MSAPRTSALTAIALTGPTASGKTALSLRLAEALGAEIISCDSMQLYRGMDIGTAKATPEERARVPHHMLDILTPGENYSAECYRADALRCAEQIAARGHLPLFVGGTGLYVRALLRASGSDIPESDPAYRARWEETLTSEAAVEALWQRLQAVDPDSAAAIHKNNTRRVIRALEIYERTGIPKSVLDARSREAPPDIRLLHLTLDVHDRQQLYQRVDRRVDEMLRAGLGEEVQRLLEAGHLQPQSTAAQAIGYKEILAVLAAGGRPADAREAIQQASRRYAKRQLTWFRHEPDACQLYLDTPEGRPIPQEQLAAQAFSLASAYLSQIDITPSKLP